MPIKTTKLSYEEFYNKLLSLLILVEGKRQYVYTDSVNVVTIGIGVNVEEQKWRNIILMYKVGILQYTDLENNIYTLANILGKQSQSMQTLINTTSKEIQDKIVEYKDNKNLKANSSQEKIKKNVETIQNLYEGELTIQKCDTNNTCKTSYSALLHKSEFNDMHECDITLKLQIKSLQEAIAVNDDFANCKIYIKKNQQGIVFARDEEVFDSPDSLCHTMCGNQTIFQWGDIYKKEVQDKLNALIF